MKEYIFTKTANSSRGGLMVSFPLWDKAMFLKEFKESGKAWRDQYRYGFIGGYMHNFKDMSLEEFEQIFPEQPFSEEQITVLFRKEVSLKYGEHKQKALLKPISKKDLILGRSYKDLNGDAWIYIGQVEKTTNKMAYQSDYEVKRRNYTPEVLTGFGFIPEWRLKYGRHADSTQVLKSIKKLFSEAENKSIYPFPESEQIIFEFGDRYDTHQRIVTVKLLNKW